MFPLPAWGLARIWVLTLSQEYPLKIKVTALRRYLPPWWRHAAIFLMGVWLVFAAFQQNDLLHEFDMGLTVRLQDNAQRRLHRDIVVADVSLPVKANTKPSSEPEALGPFRVRLGKCLKKLAEDRDNLPRAVVLDFAFDGGVEKDGVTEVREGLQALKAGKAKVRIFGAFEVLRDGQFKDDEFAGQHRGIYELVDTWGHTYFEVSKGSGAVFYTPVLPETGRTALSFMVKAYCNAPDDLYLYLSKANSEERFLHMGTPLEGAPGDQLLRLQADGSLVSEQACTKPDLRGRVLILGRLAEDRPLATQKEGFLLEDVRARSGPELVAWALSDLLGESGEARRVAAYLPLHAGLAVVMPLAAFALFGALLRYLGLWRLRPARVALLAGLLSLGVPGLLVLILRVAGLDYGQVLLPICLTALALGVAIHYRTGQARRIMIREKEAQGAHKHVAYDIFISYRRIHTAYVQQTLIPLLRELRRSNGTPFSIFWDNEDLHAGDFLEELERAVYDTRIFLPLLTPTYLASRYCRWELRHACNRLARGGIHILPLMHGGFDHVRDGHPDFPALGALHGYGTTDPDLPQKLTRDLRALDAQPL